MELQKPPQVKITTKDGHTNIYIDDYRCHHVTGIKATWDNCGFRANVTVSMLAEIEVDAESAVLLKFDDTQTIEAFRKK
jgi:hypothetical protein